MKTRRIHETNLTASVLALAPLNVGSAVDRSSSEKILETYPVAGAPEESRATS